MNPYIRIARPDHWLKNVFILPGVVFASLLAAEPMTFRVWVHLAIGFIATCLIASADYVINEWLDAEFDRHHPTKSQRPAVAGGMNVNYVMAEYLVLSLAGVALSWLVSPYFLFSELVLLGMGILYNVRPFRSKDIAFFDVLTESFNNVVRLFLGWFIVVSHWLPPVSIVVGYWMGGAFLMAVKRYAEYRMIDDPARAGLYRKSFRTYSEKTLLISAFFYGLVSVFFCGIFLIKYRVELLLAIPLLCGLFCVYLYLSFEKDSVVQKPEKLYQQHFLMGYCVVFVAVVLALLFIHIPILNVLMNKALIRTP